MSTPNANLVPATEDQTRKLRPDFKLVESQRPDWTTTATFHYTKTVDRSWTFAGGSNDTQPPDVAHVAIDPYEDSRPVRLNYKLLISSIAPTTYSFCLDARRRRLYQPGSVLLL
jgi:hypothetical protein